MNKPRHKTKLALVRTPHVLAIALCLGLGTLALFWNVRQFGFVNLDDDLYVYENTRVLSGFTLDGLRYAFTTADGGSWMPLTWLSYQLDVALWGDSASGFHTTNMLLHAVTAALLFITLTKMTRETWPCAFVAALFAVHPLRVESVVWIAERKDVLSGALLMLTLIAYIRHAAKPCDRRMAIVFACLTLGLMAKPILVTAPALLLLLDMWPLRRIELGGANVRAKFLPLLREKLPLFGVVIGFAALTIATQRQSGAVFADAGGMIERVARVMENCGFYLEKFFWPASLNVLYPASPLSAVRFVVSSLVIVVCTGIAIRFRRRQPWLATGWFWFLISLLPVIGIVPIGSTWVADRYSYLPSIGITVMLAWTVASLAKSGAAKLAANVVALTVVTALAFATFKTMPRWANSTALFTDSVGKGSHPGAFQNLGAALAAVDNHPGAIEQFTRSLELNPANAQANFNRANSFVAIGETDSALADFSRAIDLRPDYAGAWNNRGNLHASRREFDIAISDFTHAIELRPADADALLNRAKARLEVGKLREAVEDFSSVITLKSDFAPAHHDRAVALLQLAEYDRAWADIRACRQLGVTPHPELLRRLEVESGRREQP